MFLIGGIVLYKMIDHSKIDYQYLDSYRKVTHELVDCVPSSCSQGTLRDGVRYYVHWVDLFPHSMEAFNAAGFCFYHLHEYSRALKYFNQAIILDPQNTTIYFNQALTLLNLGDYPNALETFRKGAAFLTMDTILRPNIVFPFKRTLGPITSQQAALIYNYEIFDYGEIMSLDEQITHTSNDLQRMELIKKLRQKINTQELYYFIPIIKTYFQGKQVFMM